MSIQSIKARLIGGYGIIVLLFIIQLPIVYFLVGSMSKKYEQVEVAGALRKRAVEITEVLTRHIATGNEDLEKDFQKKKVEYDEIIASLRSGTGSFDALSGADLEALVAVDEKWKAMRRVLDEAMEAGDNMRLSKAGVEESLLDGPGIPALSPVQRQLVYRQNYIFERYMLASVDAGSVGEDLKKAIEAFDRSGVPKGALAEAWAKRRALLTDGVKAQDAYRAEVDSLLEVYVPGLVASANELTRSIAAEARADALRTVLIMGLTILASIVIALVFMWTTNTQILKPIFRIRDTVDDFSHGNLMKRADVKVSLFGRPLNDEISELGGSVDRMAQQMSGLIGKISDSSDRLASASEELSSGASHISDGANAQSTQTAQVATAMEEMNATVIEVARNSQRAAESAQYAQETAVKGGDVVAQAIVAMQEVAEATSVTADNIRNLGRSSEEIGTIVSVINDIADQTNLLALNAAIEAARAGEQGRGFAVVADEVRKLAERTTKATKEISTMIKTIQGETSRAVAAMAEGTVKVENGVRLANSAGESLQMIVSGVESVSDMIRQIATSAEEQSAMTDEMSRNMESIADVAKSNVATVSQVAGATSDLAGLAAGLKEMVSRFKVSGAETVDYEVVDGVDEDGDDDDEEGSA